MSSITSLPDFVDFFFSRLSTTEGRDFAVLSVLVRPILDKAYEIMSKSWIALEQKDRNIVEPDIPEQHKTA